jgi:hypothetical protein
MHSRRSQRQDVPSGKSPGVAVSNGGAGSVGKIKRDHGMSRPAETSVAPRSHWKRRITFLIGLSAITWLNLTGFCYSQFRYVSVEELIEKALVSDWREIMKIAAQKNPDKKSISMSQFLRNTRVWARVGGREFQEALSFDSGATMPHFSPGVYRFLGCYQLYVAIVFDVGVGKEPYELWGHVFDDCSRSVSDGYSDSVNSRDHISKDWGLRRLIEVNDKILISKDEMVWEEKAR